MRYKDRTIRSVGDMLAALKAQVRGGIWFRGHSRKEWKLVPGLARVPGHLKAENAIIKRFMQNAMPHISVPPTREWEWMFLMQHHRAATRLLDWSESPLAALYFAVSEKGKDRYDGAVWCLDPIALNNASNLRFNFSAEIPAFGQDSVLDSYLPSHVDDSPAQMYPVAIVGPRNTPRMAAQLGVFTVNHQLHTPIEEIGNGKHVWRWVVPKSAKKDIEKELSYLRYTALTLFPELDRVAELSRELLREI